MDILAIKVLFPFSLHLMIPLLYLQMFIFIMDRRWQLTEMKTSDRTITILCKNSAFMEHKSGLIMITNAYLVI